MTTNTAAPAVSTAAPAAPRPPAAPPRPPGPPPRALPTAPKATGVMRMGSVIKGKLKEPRRALLMGTEGIGKSTFGAESPDPIFLGIESGTGQLDVQRFPEPQNFNDVRDAIRELREAQHDRKTLVIDTVDWLEPLVWAHVCARDGKSDIEDYGYGKGYLAAFDAWRELISDLERLRRERGMEIILIGHTTQKTFKNPQGDDFDRYELKLHPKAAGLLKEWVDSVLFASFETLTVKANKQSKAKGVSTGARILHTERSAAFDAKSRFSLPPVLALSYADYAAACDAGQALTPTAWREAIEAKLQFLPEALRQPTVESVARCGEDAHKLAQLHNWVLSKMEGAPTDAAAVEGGAA